MLLRNKTLMVTALVLAACVDEQTIGQRKATTSESEHSGGGGGVLATGGAPGSSTVVAPGGTASTTTVVAPGGTAGSSTVVLVAPGGTAGSNTGAAGGPSTGVPVIDLTGSYEVRFDKIVESSSPYSLVRNKFRVDFRQTESTLQAALAAENQTPRLCSAERRPNSVVLTCPTSEESGSYYISRDEVSAPWKSLELSLAADGRVSGSASAQSSFKYLRGDIITPLTASATGTVGPDTESPQLIWDQGRQTSAGIVGWLPWDQISVAATEGLTDASLSAVLPRVQGLEWTAEHAGSAPWFGATGARAVATDWSVSGTSFQLDQSQLVRDLAGNGAAPDGASRKIFDLGSAQENYLFDSTLQAMTLGTSASLVTADVGGGLCESGGCVKLEGLVDDCGTTTGGIAGRLQGRAATKLSFSYRLALGELQATNASSEVYFRNVFTVKVGAPGAGSISTTSGSVALDRGELTEERNFTVDLPEALRGKDVGFSIQLYEVESRCASPSYWGGPIKVFIDRIELI